MTATKQNLVLEQGTTVHYEFQLYDANNEPLISTSGFSAISRVRQSYESNTIYDFTTSFANGALHLDMTPAYSANVKFGNYYYTVQVTDGSNVVVRSVEGMITCTPKM